MRADLFENLAGTSVLVIGDLMLDRYWWGDVHRISPEAPVPVVRLNKSSISAGGAANVAVNVAGLTATPLLIGIVGDDPEAKLVHAALANSGVSAEHLLEVRGRHTTVKTRVIAHHQQITRVDQEIDEPIAPEVEDAVVEKFETLLAGVQVVIISDYAKGLLTDMVLARIIGSCVKEGKPVLVDPKGKDYSKYRGSTLITPNQKEAAEACNLDERAANVIEIAGDRLLDSLNSDALLITQGENGMTLFRRARSPRHFPAVARDVYDVTGAGDTVIATMATTLGAGFDLETATDLANLSAGIVVEQVGTTSIEIDSLRNAVELRGSAKALAS